MGNEIFIQDKRVCEQPLRGRLEAIQTLQPPTMVDSIYIETPVNLQLVAHYIRYKMESLSSLHMKAKGFQKP